MPFTAAHPAAVLPLRRWCPRYLSWSALVIGSLTPDLESFLVLAPRSVYGATLFGSFYFCLPVGLVLFLLFRQIVKRPAILLLPAGHRRRLWPPDPDALRLDRGVLLRACVSIMLGAWTHLLWDSFTHVGRGITVFPFLATPLGVIGNYQLTGFRLLQHVSTLLGIALLALAYLRWYRTAETREAPRIVAPWLQLFRFVPAAAATAIGITLGLRAARPPASVMGVVQFVGYAAIGMVSAASVALLAIAVAIRIWKKRLVADAQEQPSAEARVSR
jgi:hypothetical protein